MDYSAMDVVLGPRDPLVNGYTRLREATEDMRWDLGRIDDGLVGLDPFYPEEEPLTIEEIRELITANDANFPSIEEALAMEQIRNGNYSPTATC